MSAENYKKAIDILNRDDLDWKSVVIEIAKSSPAHVVKAVGEVDHPNLVEECRCIYLEQDRKIEAIKLYRQQTGADLKEAKEFIESLK